MIDPFGLIARLKRLAAIFVALIFGMALFTHLASALISNIDASWLLVFLLFSPTAYFIRETGLRSKRRESRQNRGVERTPVAPNHGMENN